MTGQTFPRHAVRCGLRRGRIEFVNSMRSGQDIGYYVMTSLVLLAVLWLNRDNTIVAADGTSLTTAAYALPGLLALQVVFAGAFGIATVLSTEREDGTLLRLRAAPGGMIGYATGQVTRVSLEIAFSIAILLIPALLLIPGLTGDLGVGGLLGLLGYLLLGFLATVPLGFVVGSIFNNPRSVGGWGMLIMAAVVYVSGIFVPSSVLPGWVAVIGQLFPPYWMGLGLRSAALPDSAAAVEIGESWRTLMTLGVLGLWAAIGLTLAPMLLRRMARRESGSAVAARREKQLQRVG